MDVATQKLLLQVSEFDKQIVLLNNERQNLEEKRRGQLEQLKQERERLKALEGKHASQSKLQSDSEERLRAEEKRIVERRKQLSVMGGVKSAKLAERELDIAARAMQSMEEQTLRMMQEAESTASELAALRESLSALEQKLESDTGTFEASVTAIVEKISEWNSERQAVAESLDTAIVRLYDRIRTRYPVGAVSEVENGSCSGCFRALPPQLVNQILAAAGLMQCPSCSRILVLIPSESPAA